MRGGEGVKEGGVGFEQHIYVDINNKIFGKIYAERSSCMTMIS